jgi:5'-phosphate synthase pdxT subunit
VSDVARGRAATPSPPTTEASAETAKPLVGVLALQGDFEAHAEVLERLGASVREVRTVADVDRLDGLVIPGGESTSMTIGIEREGLAEPLRELTAAGLPVFGSCAGLIMLDRNHLGVMDILAARNAFGRQVKSFEADVELAGLAGGPVRALFIRAPWIAEHGPRVDVLARVGEGAHPVAASQDAILAVAFHTELGRDDRIHSLFLERVRDFARACAARDASGTRVDSLAR